MTDETTFKTKRECSALDAKGKMRKATNPESTLLATRRQRATTQGFNVLLALSHQAMHVMPNLLHPIHQRSAAESASACGDYSATV